MATRSVRTFLASAECYDRNVDWPTRLQRDMPFLVETFGPPGKLGLLDAGCGTGRHSSALAKCGYRVTGADTDTDMLRYARKVAKEAGARVRFVHAAYADFPRRLRGPFDGLMCIGNSLALAGSERDVRSAVDNFGRVVRPGGRLVIQVINYAQVRQQAAHGGCVRGPNVTTIDGREYVSFKVFHVAGKRATVTGVTLWKEETAWKRDTFQGHLCPIEMPSLSRWLRAAGFRIVRRLGSYAGKPYDAEKSTDLVVVAERAK